MKIEFKISKVVVVSFGEDVVIIHPSNIYGCNLKNNVFIGPFCEIQSDVQIGERTKIQSHTFVCSLVTIGDDCFVGHGVVFINDTFSQGMPAQGNKSLWARTNISNNVYIGSNSSIMPVNICSDVVIGAGSVVTKDITKPGTYAGNPAIKIK